MSRKKKRGAQKPPLSALDKNIYWILIWLNLGIAILFWIGFGFWIPREVGFSEAGVVACSEQWGVLASLYVALFGWLTFTIILSSGLDKKQPIFGNKAAKPLVLQPMLTVYPLISKEFWQKMTRRTKEKIITIGIVLAVLLCVCITILWLSFYPRTVLYEDMHMERYGITNQMTDIRHLDTADSITIAIERHTSGGKSHRTYYDLYLRASFGEESYDFETDEFEKMSDVGALRFLISVRERYGSRINITGADMAQTLIRTKKWGSEEKALLYELFDLK
ncbi:MAG: hypothetical protein IJ489_03960 [Clostridia bacterium]|nr:hypothetical protein [Clostridia bacterium]